MKPFDQWATELADHIRAKEDRSIFRGTKSSFPPLKRQQSDWGEVWLKTLPTAEELKKSGWPNKPTWYVDRCGNPQVYIPLLMYRGR